MTTDFQKNILKYLIQTPEGSQLFPSLDSSLFDLVTYQIAFDILSKYYKSYGRLPTQDSLQQILAAELKESGDLPEGIEEELVALFDEFRLPLDKAEHEYIRDTLISSIQEKKADQFVMAYGERNISMDQLYAKIGQLTTLKGGNIDLDIDNLLIQDRHTHTDDQIDGAATFLHDLNKLTSARGFYSPQLIIFASGPKHFKTGIIIKLAIEYARGGLNVYYADGENGKKAIRNRAKMSIMGCTLRNLYKNDLSNEDLKAAGCKGSCIERCTGWGHCREAALTNLHKFMDGDIFIDYFPAGTTTVNDVKNRLAQIYDTKGWAPDLIIWDSIDHFLPSNPVDQKRDTRIQIQKVYHEVIALNNDLNTFAIAPSQVKQTAVSKKVFDLKDLSEDFGKVMNAHAVFAICADEIEMEEDEDGYSIRRILPIVQREGEKYNGHNHCVVRVNEKRMTVEEVDKGEYYKDVTDD